MMESFWGTMQLELLDSKAWQTREELANHLRVDRDISPTEVVKPRLGDRSGPDRGGRPRRGCRSGSSGRLAGAPRPRGWVEVGGVHRSRSSAPPMLSSIQPYGAPPGV
jgi:hypothetical protein